MTEGPIYLDHAASSPMQPEVLEAMLPYLTVSYANPSGVHAGSRAARRALDDARDELSGVLGCAGDEIVFTSGGTEADNLAILGARRPAGSRSLVSAIEHPAVLRAAERIGAQLIAVDQDGRVDLDAFIDSLAEDVALVSVMTVNNEVGTIQPIAKIASLVRDLAPEALLHTDAVQAIGWLEIAERVQGCEFVSISAHKFGGPRGIGALVVRARARDRIAPLLAGGEQERELRPGTENVAGAIGMARAASISEARRVEVVARVGALKRRLLDDLRRAAPGMLETVGRTYSIASIANVRFPGVLAEELLIALDDRGLAASAGSACASGALEPSHVLSAIGCSESETKEAIRFSLGPETQDQDIARAVETVLAALKAFGQA